ncbi:MAG: hypothetical protein IPM48_03480 [Saprospiraceae bacterium]|nr:hypothetical protein [Saprospiraceae bacterium]
MHVCLCKSQTDDGLLALLGDEETTEYAQAIFKTNRIINLHSIENTHAGVLDFKILHRFGFLNTGVSEFFGLDQATMRLGFDYGLSKNIQIGIGRSNFEKTYDGYIKYRFLRQSSGKKQMPLSASFVAGTAIKTNAWPDPNRDNHFSSRLYYHFQLLLARKFSEGFSAQITPSLVHRNLVATKSIKNDVYSIAAAVRQKLSKRIALNAEFIYVLPDQIDPNFNHSFSIGFDIETGGHVFQLHFTNSTSMVEKGFIAETVGDWTKGDIRFGFNISRVFTLVKPKKMTLEQ